jgi:tetratricopeptide (TPR) repeat protein
LEFSAPRALYLDTTMTNRQSLQGFKTADLPDLTPSSKGFLQQPDVRYGIGVAYLSRGVLADALTQFQHALQIDPDHTRSLLGASRVQLGLHRPAESLALAKQVIAREPLNANALFLAGLASRALNATTDAAEFLERAANLDPQNAEFRKALGSVSGTSTSPADHFRSPIVGREISNDSPAR